MKNIELNAGGLIGALLCGGIAAVIVFYLVGDNTPGRGAFKIPIAALIGGAFAGNFLWSLIFKKNDES